MKSFRSKDDPYMRMTSRYELKKDANERDYVSYEAFVSKRSNNHIQNAIKRCKLDQDKIRVTQNNEEDDEEEKENDSKLQRK